MFERLSDLRRLVTGSHTAFLRRRVAIVGGGFAGLCAARALAPRHAVTLFDPRACFEFLPNIHELVSGHITPSHLRLPHADFCARHGVTFVQERITELMPAIARLTTGSGREHAFDLCVVAIGAVDTTGGVPGAEAHAMPFKSVDDCAAIGQRLELLLSERGRLELVVVGGGLEGIEALGELLRRLRGQSNWHISLIEARSRLLEEAPAVLDRVVRDHCAGLPVDFHLGARVRQLHEGMVELDDGTCLRSGLTLWTGGGTAPRLLFEAGLSQKLGQWAPVTATLESVAHRHVFVVGDAAALPDPLAKQAYHAMDMGQLAARNIEALAEGRAPRSFVPSTKPMVISFGDLDTWVVMGQRVLAGTALSTLKKGILETTLLRLDPPRDAPTLLFAMRRATGGIEGMVHTLLDTPSNLRHLSGVRVL